MTALLLPQHCAFSPTDACNRRQLLEVLKQLSWLLLSAAKSLVGRWVISDLVVPLIPSGREAVGCCGMV